MLDLLGKGYVIEHCISFFKNKQKMKSFQYYITDVGYIIANTLGKRFGAAEDLVKERFKDISEPKKPKKEETKEEIIDRIRKKLEG